MVGLRRTGLRPINKTKVNDMEIEILQEVFMKNNDILIRLRYALDIKDNDMVEIFKLGGIDVTKEDVHFVQSYHLSF